MLNEELYNEIPMSLFSDKYLVNHRFPLAGGIELTSECNLRCVHCYEASCRNKRNMGTSKLKSIIDDLADMGTLSVFLTGGEAMLRQDFDEIYRYIREKGILVSILSNGTTITDEKIELFKEYPPVEISISVYGATEDTYRETCLVEGAYDKMLMGLERLYKNNIHFNLKTVLMDTNIHDLQEMRNLAKRYGTELKIFTNIRPMNDGNKNPMNHMLSLEKIIEVEKNDPIISNFYKDVAEFKKSKWKSRKDKDYRYLCRIASNSFFIANDGILYGCVRERLHGYDLNKGSIKEAWTNHFVSTYVNSVLTENAKCRNCEYMKYCDYCPAQFELETGDVNNPPDDFCRLARMRKMTFESEENIR